MHVIRKQLYYDTISQCYKNILVINEQPSGPLAIYIKKIKLNYLSPFQAEAERNNNCCRQSLCQYAILEKDRCNLLCADRIGDFFLFVIQLGYKIDSGLTKLSKQGGDHNVVCIIYK